MLSLPHSVFSLLLLHTLTGVSCEDLTLDQAEQFPSEGSSVTLTYKFNKEQINDYYFFWYRQDPGKAPEFLVSVSGTGAPLSASVPGLSATVKAEERKVELQINSAAVRDSAVYYCAVRPNTGTKLVFGSGTRLKVEPSESFEPSFFYLSDGNGTKACLATGFSRHDAVPQWAESTESLARISEDSLYSQVLLLKPDQNSSTCGEQDGRSDLVCTDTLDRDPTVNTVTLLVLVLRLIFIKTVVFNVLMTLRLWIQYRNVSV